MGRRQRGQGHIPRAGALDGAEMEGVEVLETEPETHHPADEVNEPEELDPTTGMPFGVVAVAAAGPNGGKTDGRKVGVQQRDWPGCPMFPKAQYPTIRATAGNPASIRIEKEIAPGYSLPFNARNARNRKHFALNMQIEDIGERWGNGKYTVSLWSDANSTRGTERILQRTIVIDNASDFLVEVDEDGQEHEVRKVFPTDGITDDPSIPLMPADERRPLGGRYDDRDGYDYGPEDGPPRDDRDPRGYRRERDRWGRPYPPEKPDTTPALVAAVAPVVTAFMDASARRDTAQQQIAAQMAAAQQAAQQATMQMMMQMQQQSNQMLVAMLGNKPAGGTDEVTKMLLTHLVAQKQQPQQDPIAAVAANAQAMEKLRDIFGGDDAPEGEGGIGAVLANIASDPQKLQTALGMLQTLMGGGPPQGPQPPMHAHVHQHQPPPQVYTQPMHSVPGVPPDPQMPQGDDEGP